MTTHRTLFRSRGRRREVAALCQQSSLKCLLKGRVASYTRAADCDSPGAQRRNVHLWQCRVTRGGWPDHEVRVAVGCRRFRHQTGFGWRQGVANASEVMTTARRLREGCLTMKATFVRSWVCPGAAPAEMIVPTRFSSRNSVEPDGPARDWATPTKQRRHECPPIHHLVPFAVHSHTTPSPSPSRMYW